MIEALFSMQDKICVVTGGSRGLGASMTQGFLEAGAKRVYITARKAKACIDAAEELSQYGECIALPCDLSTSEGMQTLVTELMSREQHLDVLVNNAGAGWGANFGQFPEKGWDKVMDINIKAIFFATQKFLPLLKASGNADDPARVINIASINGIRNSGMPTYAYSASKSGVIHLTEHLATDLASHHINVNAIAPGFIETAMTDKLSDDQKAGILGQVPAGRMGTPNEIAAAVVYLSSAEASYVTGATLHVNGGMAML